MVSRSSRLAWLIYQMRQEIVDLAEVQFAKKIASGDTVCVLRALNSPIARARGWGTQGGEFNAEIVTNNLVIQNVTIEPVPSGVRLTNNRMRDIDGLVVSGSSAQLVIEGEQDTRTIDDL
jgi:hypothetical protein